MAWRSIARLAVLIDLFSPKVIGWAMSERMTDGRGVDLVVVPVRSTLVGSLAALRPEGLSPGAFAGKRER